MHKSGVGNDDNSISTTKELAQSLGNLTILRKGPEDIISDGQTGTVTTFSLYCS
jgi:hypothetical protein